MKMDLYERLKIDALGTSQKRHPKEVFLGQFKDVRSTFFLNLRINNT